MQDTAGQLRKKRVRISRLIHPDENWSLYDRTRDDDEALQASVRKNGVLSPPLVTLDRVIVSGNRRVRAADAVCQGWVSVLVLPIKWSDLTSGERLELLREHNRHRDKSLAEQLRESIVDTSRDEAHRRLCEHRRKQMQQTPGARDFGDIRVRSTISDAKMPMVEAIQQIVKDFADHLPVTLRHIHYALLNIKPLKHAGKPGSRYRNDQQSYNTLTKLVNRMRLEFYIDVDAICDPTRPTTTWEVFSTPRPFIDKTLDGLFKGYYRNLMQTQPHHIEILAEKLTVQNIITSVASDYCIPVTIGRGFCSLPPLKAMVDRYEKSGKDKLIVIGVSDHDPDGEQIVDAFAKGLRDDFYISGVELIKAAVGPEHIKRYSLHPSCDAKPTSANFKRFSAAHGTSAYELEALTPRQLQDEIRRTIDSVIDVDAYNAEVDREKDDAAELDRIRGVVHAALNALDLEGGA